MNRLIDATLPALRLSGLELPPESSRAWINCLTGLGVKSVKNPDDELYAPGSIIIEDSEFLGQYQELFAKLLKNDYPEVAFPGQLNCQTALAVSWLEEGGRRILCAASGEAGLSATEEVLMFLKISGFETPPDWNLGEFKDLYQKLAKKKIRPNKAVIGPAIFAVESGIHIDGLIKDPSLYEPYSPELVKSDRLISVGRHSSRSSIKLKCHQLSLECPDTVELLNNVHDFSLNHERGLTDDEFLAIFHSMENQS